MAGETVLIAAFSGRALAQSARRAGFVPLVVDAFGDADTRNAAAHYAHLPDAIRLGFRGKPLRAACDRLIAESGTTPIGIVLGSGFEDRPKLIDALAQTYGLLGTKADTVAEVKDPAAFFPLLKQLGIAHPETSLTPPADPQGWIAKRRGAAGGAHIRLASPERKFGSRYYFQRRLPGIPMSILAMVGPGGMAFEFSRQWTAPSARRPFRYGGAVSISYAETPAHDAMVRTTALLIELLDPVGLVSFDFIVDGETPYLLEMNPRPGATLDIFDDATGSLFKAHIDAGRGQRLTPRSEEPDRTAHARAAALLYAPQATTIAHELDWPSWVADRPMAGAIIPAEAPLATVKADGATDADAERLVRARLAELDNLIYRHKKP